MTTPHPLAVAARHAFANTARSRGEVVVLPGRGENAAVYERLGARIAYDGYTVTILELPPLDVIDADWLDAASVPIGTGEHGPITLVGVDSGAVLAALLAPRLGATGVVLAGLGGLDLAADAASDDDRIALRTACPVHSRRLADAGADLLAPSVESVDPFVAERFDAAHLAVPTLVLHGTADTVTPVDRGVAAAHRLSERAEIVLVEGGRHDILNDVTHRTTSAELVQFLERRGGPVLDRTAGATLAGAIA